MAPRPSPTNLIWRNIGSWGAAVYLDSGGTISYNTIADSAASGTGEASSTIYVAANRAPVINHNDIYSNASTYDLANANPQGSSNLDAKNNWWGTNGAAEIAGRIYDFLDNSTRGFVSYLPYLLTPELDVPDFPPVADAGSDQGGYIGERVMLDGGEAASTRWAEPSPTIGARARPAWDPP